MPRKPRIFIEGGIYHVYNRFTNGEPIFQSMDACGEFLDLLRTVKIRDGLSVFAYCLMSNHYHLALRTGAIQLSRSMRTLNGRFSLRYNVMHQRYGPLWQGRYKARFVDDPSYLTRLVLYIHLNPVTAGVVSSPEEYSLSGHRELITKTAEPVVDVDDTLTIFGETLRAARRQYLQSIRHGCSEDAVLTTLPWWRRSDRQLEPKDVEHVDVVGRSTGLERPKLAADAYLERVCRLLGTDVGRLASRARNSETASLRRLVSTLGIERWEQRASELAIVLDKNPGVVSSWASRGGWERLEDEKFAATVDDIDRRLSLELTS
jgi:REP element-mobilizing transposase RayT